MHSRLPCAVPRAAPAPLAVVLPRILRRVHLYSGLALLPFVLIYGVSAFLFNHAGGSAATQRHLTVPAPALDGYLSVPADAAERAAAALGGAAPVAASAAWRGSWVYEFEQDGRRQRLALAADGSSASLRPVSAESSRSERLPGDLCADLAAAAEHAALAALAAAGVGTVTLRRAGAPTLRYRTDTEEVVVALDRGQVTLRQAAGFDLGRLLMRLHTAHGYGGDRFSRLLWAAVVDAMAAAMVLWAVSGLVMWWQKRSHRRIGLYILAATVAATAALVVFLHESLLR